MKHVIIGTAGHVDHGKTTLIKALTGINADRLKEEQERGLTIDIGFAWFDLPSGRRAGIVDVPGHEKFIKNMLAGAIGIDIVVLVIAADEGIMPQTQEHLNILSLLEVKNGLVALTKMDMVEEEWLELVQEDIREQLQDSFLADSPIVPVSAITGDGLDRLIAEIDQLTQETEAKNTEHEFRLPIDRAFSVRGFGTVVTGTLLEGTIKVGDLAEIQPLMKKTRVRTIQNHGVSSDRAFAGQRVALNLADVTVEDCHRGQVLAAPGLLRPTMMLDVMLKLLPDAERSLKHWDRIRLYSGTSEALGRVVLFGRDEIWPGEEIPVQLRLEKSVVALRDDRFVIRSYSPLKTIGGGHIIDAHPTKKRRFRDGVIENLQLRATGSAAEVMIQSLTDVKKLLFTRSEALKLSGLRDGEQALEELLSNDLAIQISQDNGEYVVLADQLDHVRAQIVNFLTAFHKQWPMREGVVRAEIRSRFLEDVSARLYQQVIVLLGETGEIVDNGEYVQLVGHKVEFSGQYGIWKEQILATLTKAAFSPPSLSDLATELHIPLDSLTEIYKSLTNSGDMHKIGDGYWLLTAQYEAALQILVEYLQVHGTIDLATFRNLLDTSRKYALPLLEYFDQLKITKRRDNERVLIKRK